MKPLLRISLLSFILLTFLFLAPQRVSAQEELPVVRAVLFFSPTCPHCEQVIEETLPPILEKYGDQLQIVGINTFNPQGQELFMAAMEQYQVADERTGVPALYIGDKHLVGSLEIPELLPGLIEEGLASGGIDWPAIPGLAEVVADVDFAAEAGSAEGSTEQEEAAQDATAEESTAPTAPTEPTAPEVVQEATESSEVEIVPIGNSELKPLTMLDMFKRDIAGNTIAVVVLVGMIVVIGYIFITINKAPKETDPWPNWIIPVLVAIGLIVAGYLTYVETTNTEAACGPVGDCNTVQQSPYAILFGFLPVGVLGLIGYVAILIAWIVQYYGPQKFRDIATIALWGMAMFGTIFSIYLTYLEPFVIGATCMWCITSAVVQTALLWLATPPAKRVWELADLEDLEVDDGDKDEPEEAEEAEEAP